MFDICVFNLALEKSLIATYHIYGVLWFHLQNRVFPPPSGEAGDGIGSPEAPLLQCWPLTHARAHTRVRGIRSRKQVKHGLSVTPFPRGHLIKLIFTDRSCYLQQEVGFICRTVETGLLGNAMDPLETSSLLKRSINITSCHTSENVRLSANEPADIGLEHSSIPC